VNNSGLQNANVLWLDTVSPLSEEELLRLRSAGVQVLKVRSASDLGVDLKHVDAIVIRLTTDTGLLDEVKRILRGLLCSLPLICRVDRHCLEVGVQAMHGGAFDVIASDEWSESVWRSMVSRMGRAPDVPSQSYVFVDPSSQKLLELARRVAAAGVTTLLTGPTGVGKEVLARILHEASPRRNGPFVGLNCAAIPETMIEDLLFGHEKGAFTGAAREHKGVFEQAEGGSLFLDEIGEMPFSLQSKLLRVLQERQVTRLGAQSPISVDFRLIAATNKDLRAAILGREFREDLYFRISTFRLSIPPLVERPGDILPLANHLLNVFGADVGVDGFTEEAENMLLGYEWPGNVRELSNVLQRALVICSGPLIDAGHLLFDEPSLSSAKPAFVERIAQPLPELDAVVDQEGAALGPAIRNREHRVIMAALQTAPNRVEAAKALGISPRTLRYKLAQLRDHGLSVSAIQ